MGLGGALACAVTAALTVAVGLGSVELLLYLTFIPAGLLGGLIASRNPDNSIGWLMCVGSLSATLFFLPLDYGYTAQVIQHGAWPLGGAALWIAAWSWTPIIGLFLPILTMRFPDGKQPARWRTVIWLAAAGTLVVIAGLALAPPEVLVHALLIGSNRVAVVTRAIVNPVGPLLTVRTSVIVIYGGLVLGLLAYCASLAEVVNRYRHARGDERLQLKWFAYSGAVIALALLYGAVNSVASVTTSDTAAVALHLAFSALPIAIAIAILRYRLYDIDLIINRSLVYGGLTAILGAVYAAAVTLLNRLFISVSGQRSDAAYVVTAFVVVVASSPVKDWLQRQVDRRIAHRSPSSVLDELRADVDAVVSVIDVHKIARRWLDDAVNAFDARGAALYLHSSNETPLYSRGHLNGEASVEVALLHEDRQLGRLVLGNRRGNINYSQRDLLALQRSADSIAEALALAEHLGFRGPPRSEPQR